MRGRRLVLWCVAAVAALAVSAAPAGARSRGVVDLPISFAVRDLNRSLVPCPVNGAPVTLAGRIVGPRSVLSSRRTGATVTVYLHEFSFGQWLFDFPDPAYDYARLEARLGHVSVVLDRLGYGLSTHPSGYATCIGADADQEHQVVQQLRTGAYLLGRHPGRTFQHVVVAGLSGGAMVAEIEAYSFGGVDGLIDFSHVDGDPTQLGTEEGLREGAVCAAGGSYAYFGQTGADWSRDYFARADPRIVAEATPMRQRDPCGDVYSFAEALILDHLYVPRITVPVLLIYGTGDALFAQPQGGRDQRAEFSGSRGAALDYFLGCGHALPLEYCAPAVRRAVSRWLNRLSG